MSDGVSKYTIHMDYLTPEDHRLMVFIKDHELDTFHIVDTPANSVEEAFAKALEHINTGAHLIGERLSLQN